MTTLRKIQYSNLNQFLADLNSNFAQIENSPLYKGIPGNEGNEGSQGLRGIRGTQFLFVNYANFLTQFPNELVSQSNITIDFLNQKLTSFSNKQKLFAAFNVSEFVNNDVIVLTNSSMLSYNLTQDIFINTTIAFNEQTSLASSIQSQIEQYVQYYVDNNQALLNLQNVFEKYSTLAKNYTDNNSSFITNQQTASSVYSPFIAGYTTNNGIPVIDHKYFGFSDVEFPKTLKGSMVFGSMKKYIDLLMATTSTVQEQTLTSDYAPGATNIPSAIFLQDTVNAGLMFGYKSKTNLKSFGHIYKDIDDNIVIKSDSGVLESEFSKLLISKHRLAYSKLVQFGDSLEVSKNISFGGNLNNKFLRTSQYTNAQNEYTIEIGHNTTDEEIETIQRNISKSVIYSKYTSNVLVTNVDGEISHDYSLENATWGAGEELALAQIAMNPNSAQKVVTSNYLGFLIRKINNFTSFASDNYWTKTQFHTGDIPSLILGNGGILKAENTIIQLGKKYLYYPQTQYMIQCVGDQLGLGHNNTSSRITLRGTVVYSNSDYYNKVLVAGGTGFLLTTYELENTPDVNFFTAPGITSANKLIKGNHFKFLYDQILEIPNIIASNYWSKSQFISNTIPRIDITTTFNGPKITDSSALTEFLNANELRFSSATALNKFNSNNIVLDAFKTKVLVTDSNGKISDSYSLENTTYPDITDLNTIVSYPSNVQKIVTSNYLKWLVDRINSMASFVSTNYWKKSQFGTGEIGIMKTNFLTASLSFNLANKLSYDSLLSDQMYIGASGESGTLNFRYSNIKLPIGFADSILTTDSSSKIVPKTSIQIVEPFLYEHVPVGSIILWDLTFDVDIPAGWVRCNGSAIPGTSPIKYTQNMGEPFADCCYIMRHNDV